MTTVLTLSDQNVITAFKGTSEHLQLVFAKNLP